MTLYRSRGARHQPISESSILLAGPVRNVAATEAALGASANAWIGRPWAETVTGDTRRKIEDLRANATGRATGVVLESKGLASRREGTVMWVAPRDEWSLREIINARVTKSPEKIQEVLDVLTPLYEAWISLAPKEPIPVLQAVNSSNPARVAAAY